MLCSLCNSGHSERRGEFGLPTPAESNELLATKCAYALEKGLKVVFAIGEPLPIREKGVDAVIAACIKQLDGIKGLLDPAKVVIAYERTPSPPNRIGHGGARGGWCLCFC